MFSSGRALLPLLLFWVSLPASSQAKDNANQAPPGYSEAVAQAVAELDANNFPEAREEFRRAHALFPNARTLRGLGMVEFELRNYVESVRLLEQSLASTTKPLDGSLRKETSALLERARRYVGEIKVEVEPANATVTLDGAAIDVPRSRTLTLEVGEHTFEARATERAPLRRIVQLSGGAHMTVRLALTKLQAGPVKSTVRGAEDAPPGNTDPAQPRSEQTPAYKKWWVWTMVAVVVAGGATASALLLTRDRRAETQAQQGTNTIGESLHSLSGRF